MGLIYFTFLNLFFIYFLIINFKTSTFGNHQNIKENSYFSISVFFIIIFFHIIYFIIYFYTDMQIWIYGNTINSYSDSINFLNKDKSNQVLINVHNVIERLLGGHAYVEKLEQIKILSNSFENYYHSSSMNEDPEPSFIFLFLFLRSLFPAFTLLNFLTFILVISALSIYLIIISIKNIINASTAIIFLILILIYIPYFNGIFALYHHILIITAFALYLKFINLFIKKKDNFVITIILSILICFLISFRSSLIIFIPSILLSNFFIFRSKLRILKISSLFLVIYLMIQSITIGGNYNENKDGIKYGSHVLWYTFFTGLGETQKIIASADDGVGYNLAREKVPHLKVMSKEWNNFFRNESFKLISENKKDYFILILYRIKKVYENKSNWQIFNINKFKIKYIEDIYSIIYFLSIISIILTFTQKNRQMLISGILISFPIIINSNLHILIFAKNFYYYLLHPFIYFIFISIFISEFLKKR